MGYLNLSIRNVLIQYGGRPTFSRFIIYGLIQIVLSFLMVSWYTNFFVTIVWLFYDDYLTWWYRHTVLKAAQNDKRIRDNIARYCRLAEGMNSDDLDALLSKDNGGASTACPPDPVVSKILERIK